MYVFVYMQYVLKTCYLCGICEPTMPSPINARCQLLSSIFLKVILGQYSGLNPGPHPSYWSVILSLSYSPSPHVIF